MNNTPHINLNQPQYADPADIMRINESMDIIDAWAEQTDAELTNKVNKSAGWQRFGIEYVNGISATHTDSLRYFMQGNVVIIGGAITIVASTLNAFTVVADLTVPFQITESTLINCTGLVRGTSAGYQDHQRAFRVQSKDGATFPTNELTMLISRPISNDYLAPDGATTPYSFLIEGIGIWQI